MEERGEVERFARVKELFGQAGVLSGHERARFLERECAGDDPLRSEVEELLAHARLAGEFLDGMARAQEVPAIGFALAIPGFHLHELLAAGASGLVYRAEQVRPRREVAIKVLRLDTLAAGQVARFQREAEILAKLAHPGIAQVLEAGVVDGPAGSLPWIAMEYVRGREFTRWIAEERPEVRARVQFCVALCEAVQHAHGRGIVHRDLKPSNVFVSEGVRPKVLDFGIAHTREDERATSERTRTGLVMGTLAYMAPEQARGEPVAIGPASDVYALGVMLFEALTGELPLELEAVDVLEGVRRVCEVEPRRLRALAPELAPDLETILLKALEKDPLRRYASAGALGTDLANWLADRPVLARRTTITYQARKFVRRNRALTLSAVVVILSLVVALAQALGRLRSERHANQAKSGLVDFFARKYFALSSQLGFTGRSQQDAQEIIARVEDQLVLDPGNRSLRTLLAQALKDLGDLYQGGRVFDQAGRCYRRAQELTRALADEDPEDRESRSQLSRLCAKQGELARDQGDLAGRDRWFADALANDEELVARFPDDLELREDLGWSLDRIASVAVERGDEASAIRLRQRRLADALELVELEPDNWKFVRNLSHTHYFLIGVDSSADHLAECLRLAQREVELRPGARDALIWLAEAQRAARRCALDAEPGLGHALAALEIAYQLMNADPCRVEHLDLLRLTGSEALSPALELGRGALARQILEGVRRHAERAEASPGLQSLVLLVRAETMLFEGLLLAQEGHPEWAQRTEEEGLRELVEVGTSSDSPADLALCRDIVCSAVWARIPCEQGLLTRFLEPLLAADKAQRATWFADEFAHDRLAGDALTELAELRRARGF